MIPFATPLAVMDQKANQIYYVYQGFEEYTQESYPSQKRILQKVPLLPSCSLHDKWQFFPPRQQNVTTLASSSWPSGEKFELYPRHSTKRR